MFHAIALLRREMLENREACFELSGDGDAIGSEAAGYIAEDCRKALEHLGYTEPITEEPTTTKTDASKRES